MEMCSRHTKQPELRPISKRQHTGLRNWMKVGVALGGAQEMKRLISARGGSEREGAPDPASFIGRGSLGQSECWLSQLMRTRLENEDPVPLPSPALST